MPIAEFILPPAELYWNESDSCQHFSLVYRGALLSDYGLLDATKSPDRQWSKQIILVRRPIHPGHRIFRLAENSEDTCIYAIGKLFDDPSLFRVGCNKRYLGVRREFDIGIANSTHPVKSSGVICFVYDTVTGTSECHIIDAKRFEDDPVARIKITQGVPHGFHASRVAD